jgi:radical SAM superfamily enzyme YgiQ (UPF0313 family)
MKVLLMAVSIEYPSTCSCNTLGLCYLSSYAQKDAQIADQVDFSIREFFIPSRIGTNDPAVLYHKLLWQIVREKPDIIGFSCFLWNLNLILQTLPLIKDLLPHAMIILGGPEVSYLPEEVLRSNPSIDAIVRGEGEVTFSELLKCHLNGSADLGHVLGVTFRAADRIVSTPDRPLIDNLDDIPSPFLNGIFPLTRNAPLNLETYRGCIYNCTYCLHNSCKRVRYYSMGRVQEELEYLFEKKVGHISFIDSIFNVDKRRLKGLSDLIWGLDRHTDRIKNVWVMMELIDRESVNCLKKMGVQLVEAGVQSTNKETLLNAQRPFNPSRFSRSCRLFDKTGIKTHIQVMLGLPGDNLKTYKKTLEYAVSLTPQIISSFKLLVLPGSDLYINSERFGLVFDRSPPHEVIGNYSFSFEGIRRADILTASVLKEYNVHMDQFRVEL